MAFTYAAREEGKKEKEYDNKVNTLATKGYDDSNKQGMEQYRTAYENFKPFEYDVNGDALYQQYKDQYTRQGNLAMQDTIGKASAMTGGYGNSYAQQVGQQTFNGYMQALNDKIPELYALAYDKYNQEKADVYNMYQMYADADATNYNRWANDIGIYAGLHDSERAYNTDVYNAKRNLAYNEYADEQANAATVTAAEIEAAASAWEAQKWALENGYTYDANSGQFVKTGGSADTSFFEEKLAGASNNGELDDMLTSWKDDKLISEDQAKELYEKYEFHAPMSLYDQIIAGKTSGEKKNGKGKWDVSGFTLTNDGGGRLGIDRNATFTDKYGNEYSMADAFRELKKYMSASDARDYIYVFQDLLGANN
ncbi:MAG: hypothetical protein IK954_02340 [Clostridia bacterium]|nr:hypothetical protein [Clostridia bacterium]